jgi:hypothetical protein
MQKAFLGEKHSYVLSKHFVYYQGSKIEGGYYLDSDLKSFAEIINDLIYKDPERIFKKRFHLAFGF